MGEPAPDLPWRAVERQLGHITDANDSAMDSATKPRLWRSERIPVPLVCSVRYLSSVEPEEFVADDNTPVPT